MISEKTYILWTNHHRVTLGQADRFNRYWSIITIDEIKGSILLYEKLDREYHGSALQYDIIVIDNNNKENN